MREGVFQAEARARAQGGKGKSLEDRHGTMSKLSVSGSTVNKVYTGTMWARRSSSEWSFA